ncbi:MAG: hypothetical protein A2V72_02065 [Candidatus Nealsonbacteria bacterium RBG_13_37_56]|uniref:Yeast cell wall synthesis Kre9/Knh1-like N-terminal domain-containing protein n=1 Tax=Candidatus Nealsonbacteria bacterium RBG_13_37_56 TaxID=1801661 RepID=A0A1G2DXR9_9BACT|nr:MAG: hypothetical protein A2V72_02065 [Candidatus Nealsonbacteria bacterium RBG_13_37_56]
MNGSISDKFTAERNLLYLIVGAILIAIVIVFYFFFVYGKKGIEIISPNGAEKWEIGQSYEITWKAKKVSKIGIVLFNQSETKWIAKNIDAGAGKYEWKIYPGQQYGDGFWIAVFEYPWKEENEVDYSNGSFVISYPEMASCDNLSFEEEWLFLPSNFPGIRKVFITEQSYNGNLEGLEGADKKCQQEAENLGFQGNWRAFIGGEGDEESAVKRLEKTSQGMDGIFIEAEASAVLIRGDTCHRLLAKDFSQFLLRFSNPLAINSEKFSGDFLEKMDNIWLGRVNENSKKNCVLVTLDSAYRDLAEKYSYTTTCQNWTQGGGLAGDYPVSIGENPTFPTCYTGSGVATNAVALAGLSSALTSDSKFTFSEAKYCNTKQYLLCIED